MSSSAASAGEETEDEAADRRANNASDGVINRGFDGGRGEREAEESSMDVNSHRRQHTDDIGEWTPSTLQVKL